ncbi:Retrovirus-related Pol polyprotein from transposon RE2 [Bienertia sinuspersici]
MLPVPSKVSDDDQNEDVEANYVKGRIIDTGATHHMTGCVNVLDNVDKCESKSYIHLANGETIKVTRTGNSKLKCGINLKGVVYAPMFKHNLISLHKLTEEEDCRVVFTSVYCMILDKQTSNVKGIGKIERGVYKLINEPISEVITKLRKSMMS